ncbi:PemK/MazF family toxin [Halapricum desulfuricans]|uniref:PemK/MazF family toxin n=1 Tax=Halapricum desulfuricans TaxID=2841257 RepID=A0A897N8F9_9EURY|nr:PemK/MazF family toxin [Halapricum desulfuricans]
MNNSTHPFADEQHVAVAISTKTYDDSLPLSEVIWEVGGIPRESFVSPWAIHSPRSEDLVAWQGRVTDQFVDRVVDSIETYLR